MKIRFSAVFILLLCLKVYPQSVPSHEKYINLLAGMWYEVALSPADPRKECHCTTLEFEYIPGRSYLTLSVRCIVFKNQKSKISERNLKLYFADTAANLFKSGQHSKESYQVVSVTNDDNIIAFYNSMHNHLSILSRDSFVPDHKLNDILKLLRQKGYKVSTLQTTSQNCDIIE